MYLTAVIVLALSATHVRAIIPSTRTQHSVRSAEQPPRPRDLPYDDARIAPPSGPAALAQQVHVGLLTETSVSITWVTGNGATFLDDQDPIDAPAPKTKLLLAGGTVVAPIRSSKYWYNFTVPNLQKVKYISGLVSTAELTDLQPGAAYTYSIVLDDANQTEVAGGLRFRMPRAQRQPLKFVVVGDLGQSAETTKTLQLIAKEENVDAAIMTGDLSYADRFSPNGTAGRWKTIMPGIVSHQRRWDTYGRLMAKYTSSIPFMHVSGNHELETLPDNTSFAAYLTRYPNKGSLLNPNAVYDTLNASFPGKFAPLDAVTTGPSGLYYSTDVGMVHWIHLSSYVSFWPGSNQHQWLQANLDSVDRSKTPWVIVTMHAPWYTSFDNFQQNECMRQVMEPMLYKAGVDLVLSGHVHAYERSQPVYNWKADDCGPAHLILGSGGGALDTKFLEEPGVCRPSRLGTFTQPQACPLNVFNGQFCPTAQPRYSAFRDTSYGYGVLEVMNGTTARWRWLRNADASRAGSDEVWYRRNSNPGGRCRASQRG